MVLPALLLPPPLAFSPFPSPHFYSSQQKRDASLASLYQSSPLAHLSLTVFAAHSPPRLRCALSAFCPITISPPYGVLAVHEHGRSQPVEPLSNTMPSDLAVEDDSMVWTFTLHTEMHHEFDFYTNLDASGWSMNAEFWSGKKSADKIGIHSNRQMQAGWDSLILVHLRQLRQRCFRRIHSLAHDHGRRVQVTKQALAAKKAVRSSLQVDERSSAR